MKRYSLYFSILFSTLAYANSESTILYSFNAYEEGSPTSNVVTSDNGLTWYGYTTERLYKYVTKTHALKRLRIPERSYNFIGDLTLSKDKKYLYGAQGAFDKDLLFKIKIDGSEYEILHQFTKNEGYDVNGNVVLNHDESYLFGTMQSGGKNLGRGEGGIVYRLTLKGAEKGKITIIHAFSGKVDNGGAIGNLILTQDEKALYGATTRGLNRCGAIFKINLTNNNFHNIKTFDCTEQEPKLNNLIASSDGKFLYASAYSTNSGRWDGVIYQININDLSYPSKVLHQFRRRQDGTGPEGIVLSPDNKILYGVTSGGQTKYEVFHANLFRINIKDGAFAILTTFNKGSDHGDPEWPHYVSIMEGSKIPALIGVSAAGGGYGFGTLFSFLLDSESVI